MKKHKIRLVSLVLGVLWTYVYVNMLIYKFYNGGYTRSIKGDIFDGFFGYFLGVGMIYIGLSITTYGLGFNNKFSKFGRVLCEAIVHVMTKSKKD